MSIPAGTRRWPIVVIAVLIFLFIGFTVMSGFYVDLLWFREVKLSGVFWSVLRTKAMLGLIFGLLFFALLYVNLLIVRWLTPTTRILTPEQEAVDRVRQSLEPYLRWLIPLAAAALALLVGLGVSRQWQVFLLWRNGSGLTFGSTDPLFHRDPAFYVFTLPWLRFLQGWLFSSLVGVTLIVGIAHFVWGGIQPQAPAFADKVDPAVRAHLSVLLGLIMLTKAWGYYIGRFDLLTSPRGVVEGASYTDVKAQLPALNFLAIVAVICAVLFLVNIRVRLWSLPVIAVGLLAVVSVLLGTAYPAFVQQFSVKPQEQQRETPYIAYNIEGTRRAFGLDKITVSERPADPVVSSQALQENDATVSNIRLWRPSVLKENFQSLQRIRQYYEFKDVDVDRYNVSGEPRVLMVSGREISQNGIPTGGKTWQNTHLVYTHGYGAVAAQVNTATTEGAPLLTLRDIPPVGEPTIAEPRIYFGELDDVPFVVTNTGTKELDYEGASQEQETTYTGTGGIPVGNIFQRALFAWRFKDINLLISGLIDSKSRIMIYRDLAQRVPKPAPFLKFDGDPYLAVVDGRLTWIWDAYTTTNEYPYSESMNLSDATGDPSQGNLTGSANYIRNSVKVTVDAYNGDMKYYIWDAEDPIIQAWARAFPGMFTSKDEASPDLLAHVRYPENLFQVQASQFATYHVTDPAVFFQKQDVWQIPIDPTIAGNDPQLANSDAGSGPMRPYYSLMRLPGETNENFMLILPFTPSGRQNMVSWMAANSDPESYGDTVVYTFPSGRNIDGPTQVFAQINQDPDFSRDRTLLGSGGSTIVFGDFLVIPINDSLLYVQPVYVRSTQASSIPELKRVIVVNGGTVGVGTSLSEALAASTTGQTGGGGVGTGGGGTPGGTIDQQVADLLGQALQHFAAADAALTAGDLGTYQSELAQAQALVQQANDLAAQQTGTGGTGSPTPS
ncbi:MAG: UPF0182 family membrane protein, partial [Actinomycetota bacterium]